MTRVHKTLYTALQATQMVSEALQSENANEEIQTDIVILPPEKTDSLTDDEEVLEDGEKLGNALPNDVAGTLEIHCNHDDIYFIPSDREEDEVRPTCDAAAAGNNENETVHLQGDEAPPVQTRQVSVVTRKRHES